MGKSLKLRKKMCLTEQQFNSRHPKIGLKAVTYTCILETRNASLRFGGQRFERASMPFEDPNFGLLTVRTSLYTDFVTLRNMRNKI